MKAVSTGLLPPAICLLKSAAVVLIGNMMLLHHIPNQNRSEFCQYAVFLLWMNENIWSHISSSTKGNWEPDNEIIRNRLQETFCVCKSNKVRNRLQMPSFLHLFSMLELFSLIREEQLGSNPVSVQDLVLEPLTLASEFIFNAQLALFWGRAP